MARSAAPAVDRSISAAPASGCSRPLANNTFDRTAGSDALAAAGQRERSAFEVRR